MLYRVGLGGADMQVGDAEREGEEHLGEEGAPEPRHVGDGPGFAHTA